MVTTMMLAVVVKDVASPKAFFRDFFGDVLLLAVIEAPQLIKLYAAAS